jgi:hypothetical protein
MSTKDQAEEIIQIRTYRFQYGVLHLQRASVKGMTDADILEEYCDKGPLLEAWDDEMGVEEFYGLPDFREI